MKNVKRPTWLLRHPVKEIESKVVRDGRATPSIGKLRDETVRLGRP
jgi:hypothetical protein